MESIRVSQSHFLKKGFVSGRGTGGFNAICGLGSRGAVGGVSRFWRVPLWCRRKQEPKGGF